MNEERQEPEEIKEVNEMQVADEELAEAASNYSDAQDEYIAALLKYIDTLKRNFDKKTGEEDAGKL